METKTIVQTANEILLEFSKQKKRKMILHYDGIEVKITKRSTLFSILQEYKEKDRIRQEELAKLIQELMDRIEGLDLHFPI